MFFTRDSSKSLINTNVDEYGDSYARDSIAQELRGTFESMPNKFEASFSTEVLKSQLEEHHVDLGELPGWMFVGMLLYLDPLAQSSRQQQTTESGTLLRMSLARTIALFAGARTTFELKNNDITHVVVGDGRDRLQELRKEISS